MIGFYIVCGFLWMFSGFIWYCVTADTERFHWLTCIGFVFNWPGMLRKAYKEEWPGMMKMISGFKKWYKWHFSEIKDRGKWLE